jgi:hypothetical protein
MLAFLSKIFSPTENREKENKIKQTKIFTSCPLPV